MTPARNPSAEPASESERAGSRVDSAEPVLLIIADISGYTRYMTANAKTLSHSQTVITELVESILHEIELPLQVAKLEGDAVFMFCRKNDPAHSWTETRRIVGGKLVAFFRRFRSKVVELSGSVTCTCNACAHIEKLRLKLVVHSGEALFHRVANFLELAGVDVILVHRLLKNSVAADQYLLLTEAAHRDLEFPEPLTFFPCAETYDGFERVRTLVHLSGDLETTPAPSASVADPGRSQTPSDAPMPTEEPPPSFPDRWSRAWRMYLKLWFAPLATPSSRRCQFHHLENSVPPAQRVAFATLTVLLTPFMLPVGALFVLRHALQPVASLPQGPSHPPDCNCGREHH